jgi:hypothetical protein
VHVPYKGGGPMTTGRDRRAGRSRDRFGCRHHAARQGREAARDRGHRSAALARAARRGDALGAGIPGFLALAWWGIFAPAGTPKPIMDKFHAELVKALNLPDVRKTLTDTLGMDLVVSTPDALQKFLLAEMSRWGKVVKDHNIRPD